MEEKGPWKILSSTGQYDNPWICVTEHRVIHPSGNEGIYGTVHFKNLAIGIIPLDDQLNTWIVGQYRFPLERYSWEIIEGGGAHEVSPLESAKRELQEEAGIRAAQWEEILRMDLSNSVTDEQAIIFIARNLSFTETSPDESEVLELRKLPFRELYRMVLNGDITDSLSVAGVLKTALLLGISGTP